MEIIFLIMLGVFFGYIGFIWAGYGVQPSISNSTYVLPENLQFLFTLFCWGFAIPAIICGGTLFMFLAGTGIAFVGASPYFKPDPKYKSKIESRVHKISAIWGIVFSQLSIGLDFHMLYVNIIFIVISALILLFTKLKLIKNTTWWIEMNAFASICYVLGVSIFNS